MGGETRLFTLPTQLPAQIVQNRNLPQISLQHLHQTYYLAYDNDDVNQGDYIAYRQKKLLAPMCPYERIVLANEKRKNTKEPEVT